MESETSPVFYFLMLIIVGVLYLIPAFVAGLRGHHNAGAIAALNILLGWTFLGWVGALVWSLTAIKK